MNITRVKTRLGKIVSFSNITLEKAVEKMKSTDKKGTVEKIADVVWRVQLDEGPHTVRGHINVADEMPYLVFSATFKRNEIGNIEEPTGLLLLNIKAEASAAETISLRNRLQQLPQTMLLFAGSSRKTLKLVVKCLSAQETIPTDTNCYMNFMRTAAQQTTKFYSAMTGCTFLNHEETTVRGCRMSQDSNLYYNQKALPITVIKEDTNAASYPNANTNKNGFTSSDPTWEQREKQRLNFYTCCNKASEDLKMKGDKNNDDGEHFVILLAKYCRKSALPEEASVIRVSWLGQVNLSIDSIRKIFRNVYAQHENGKPMAMMNEKERTARKVRDFLERRYELRYNVMKKTEEIRENDGNYNPWRPLNDRELKRISFEQMIDVSVAWTNDIETYVRSALVKNYNPVMEFLWGCGKWNRKKDYIGELAERVPTADKNWKQLFHRWFLGMVAQWTNRSHTFGNAIVPMLIGKQGTHKSTFCRMILPPALREYFIDDIKLDSAEQVERMLCRMCLVNIDEYNSKTVREQAKIKRILTEKEVQTRRMRSEHYELLPRTASFIATTNERQPLNDSTGSRRYLCCETNGIIDTDSPINYQQLYAQALEEIENGERYYLSTDEEAKMESNNMQFCETSSISEILTTYFEPSESRVDDFMPLADIKSYLDNKLNSKDRPTLKTLAAALKENGYKRRTRDGRRGWLIKIK